MARKFLPCFLIVLAVCSIAIAQDAKPDPEVEKAKAERRAKLLATIEEDAKQLRLPENRAVISARIAASAWKTDEERARALFRSAVNDLIAAQESAEASKNPSLFQDLRNSQNIRPQILILIAGFDAEFALDAFYRSRPAAIERALAGTSESTKIGGGGNQVYLAQGEINFEQRLLRMAAEQKPERAVAMLKETIRKKLSGETWNLLQKIHQKDPAAANELANEVLARLASSDFVKNNQPNYEFLNLSNSLITEFLREKQSEEKRIILEESRVRRLAEKVIRTYIEDAPMMGWLPLEQLEPAVKRFSPASYEPLKKVAAATRRTGFGHRGTQDPEYQKFMESNPTAEAIVAAAKNFDPAVQQSAYLAAANKFSEGGQYQAAVAMLNDKMEGDALENAISSMNWYYAHHLMQKGQYDAAESVMMEFNESNRVPALTSLATTVFNANREENRSRAAGILSRVRALLPDQPEKQNEMSQVFSLVAALGEIDPAEGFRVLEPLVERLNQVTEAFAVVNEYQGGNMLREGEYVMAHGYNFGVYLDPNVLRVLAQKDQDRAFALVDGFARREVRVMLRLSLLEALN